MLEGMPFVVKENVGVKGSAAEFSRIQVLNVKTYVFSRSKFSNYDSGTWNWIHTRYYHKFRPEKTTFDDNLTYHLSDLKIMDFLSSRVAQKLGFRGPFSEVIDQRPTFRR